MEIEKKFLLTSLPHRRILGKGEAITQAYILATDPEIRVRSKGTDFYLTIKKGVGLVREECETNIPRSLFERLWSLKVGKGINKTRYAILDRGLKWEIDEYHGHLKGLYIAEVELEHQNQTVQTPASLAVVTEVTNDNRYKNMSLATQGLPPSGGHAVSRGHKSISKRSA